LPGPSENIRWTATDVERYGLMFDCTNVFVQFSAMDALRSMADYFFEEEPL
jgi:hypothetical protein